MIRIYRAGTCDVLRLPAWVDWDALAPVLDRMAAALEPRLWILSFQETQHIQFHALQQFVCRVHQMGPLPRPILLAGLNPYCEQILRFVLAPRDWDLFLEVAGDLTFMEPRGNDAMEEDAAENGQRRENSLFAALSQLSPN